MRLDSHDRNCIEAPASQDHGPTIAGNYPKRNAIYTPITKQITETTGAAFACDEESKGRTL